MKWKFLLILNIVCLPFAVVGLWNLIVTTAPENVTTAPENVTTALKNVVVIPGLNGRKTDTGGVNASLDYQKEYAFRTDWFSRHIPVWRKCLEGFKGKPNVHYLEVGLYEGRSAFWMLENVLTHETAHLSGIDLFSERYAYATGTGHKEVFFSNLKLSGSEQKATIIQGFSQIELRKLPLESFDIIYIDGSHNQADVLEDVILSWRLLKDGGILILDDYLLHVDAPNTHKDQVPKYAIDTFYFFFGKQFKVIHVDWQVLLRKKSR